MHLIILHMHIIWCLCIFICFWILLHGLSVCFSIIFTLVLGILFSTIYSINLLCILFSLYYLASSTWPLGSGTMCRSIPEQMKPTLVAFHAWSPSQLRRWTSLHLMQLWRGWSALAQHQLCVRSTVSVDGMIHWVRWEILHQVDESS